MGITLFTGCSNNATPQNLIYETLDTVKTLDPQTLSGEVEHQIAYSIYSTLVKFDSGGNIIPFLAESYTVSSNQKDYTFIISKSAKWSNDSPLTAYDFEFALKRAVNPETEAPFSHNLAPIKNANKILKGKKSVDSLGVSAINDTTLKISLEYPCSNFLQVLTTPISMPCNQDFFFNTNGYYGLNDESILSCGNYTLTDLNEKYCSIKGNDNSVYFYFDDKEKYTESLENEDVEISNFDYTALKEFYEKGYNGNISFVADTLNTLAINPNCAIANRKIVNALMSVAEFNSYKELEYDYGIYQAESIYPHSLIGTENIKNTDDSKKHKKDAENLFLDGLDEFESDFELPTFTLIYENSPIGELAALDIAETWQSKFGITVNIEALDKNSLELRLEELTYDFAIIPTVAQLPSPHTFIEQITDKKQFKIFGLSDNGIEEETEKLHKNTDTKQLSKISKIVFNNPYLKPLYKSSRVYFTGEKIVAPINSYSKHFELENSIK